MTACNNSPDVNPSPDGNCSPALPMPQAEGCFVPRSLPQCLPLLPNFCWGLCHVHSVPMATAIIPPTEKHKSHCRDSAKTFPILISSPQGLVSLMNEFQSWAFR